MSALDFRNPINWLLVLMPVPVAGLILDWPAPLTFFSACLGLIPLAALMGTATEHLSKHIGEGPGALLNATFGNACEFIIAFAALRAGLVDVVKASITGSIIGNILLVLGASMLVGGLRFQKQTFNRTAASTSATLLALAAISLVVPAVCRGSSPGAQVVHEEHHALAIAVVLFITYILSLVFSLKTHPHLYVRPHDAEADLAIGISGWSLARSSTVLLVSTALVAGLSECLVHSLESVGATLGMSDIFIGVIVVGLVGNAAEHSTAIWMAYKNKMDLAINIALGSGAQVALFIAPLLVFLSFLIGAPMNLQFSNVEVVSILVSVLILGFVATDGECNWMEGVQLLAVYAILGAAFYFLV